MITSFLVRETFGRGDVMGVRVDVSEANSQSWRCLEKIGFRRVGDGALIPGQEGRHYIYARDDETSRARERD